MNKPSIINYDFVTNTEYTNILYQRSKYYQNTYLIPNSSKPGKEPVNT